MSHAKTARGIARRTLLAGGGGMLLAAPSIVRAQAGAGVALVIGNSKYQWEAQLPNVRRDAPDIAKRFQAMGLKTELLQDLGRDAMRQALDKFKAAASGANLAAFYFAGHGANWGRDTFIVPVDTNLGDPSVVQTLVPVPSVTEATGGAANRLLVFDACRNNPADGWRQVQAQRGAVVGGGGQASGQVPNTLVMYSTAPGRVALDGPTGQNSPFAAALMRQLDGQSVDIATFSSALRRDLLIATEGRQVLWDRNSYQGSFSIKGARMSDAAVKSGWSGDPSRIIDLGGAYAFARESKFTLPQGLIAHRAPNGSRDAQMVGSFKYVSQYKIGKTPALLIVMSADDGQTAEIVLAGISEIGPFWRVSTANNVGGRLELVPRDISGKLVFSWRDANSGSLTVFSEGVGGQNAKPYSANFTRLDG